MAGISPGASSPTHSQRTLHLASTRTKRLHSTFVLGDAPALITTSRRRGDPLGVALEIGGGASVFRAHMSTVQARAMGRALLLAADTATAPAAPAAPRQACRWGHDADVVCPDCEVRHG